MFPVPMKLTFMAGKDRDTPRARREGARATATARSKPRP